MWKTSSIDYHNKDKRRVFFVQDHLNGYHAKTVVASEIEAYELYYKRQLKYCVTTSIGSSVSIYY